MSIEFKWSRRVQDELDAINKFIGVCPTVKTIWLEDEVFELLYNALKYPDDKYLLIGIPYNGKTIKRITFYGIKGND